MIPFIKRSAVLLFAATLLSSGQATPAFPVKYAANSRYLVDQNNVPFPILGRTSWFITSLSVADYHTFIDDTAARGHTAIEMHVLNHDPRGNHPPFNGSGAAPFLKQLNGTTWNGALTYGTINNEAPDFTTPNEPFWSSVDGLLAYAESKGLLVFMFPAYVGYAGGNQGWMQELVANGATKTQSYGAWIATRYKNQKNLVWMMGGDMGTSPHTFSTAQTSVESALLNGLKSVTGQQSVFFSAEWDSESIGTDQTSFGTSMTLNGAYSWTGDVNNQGRRAYAHSPVTPAFVLEEPYDEEGSDGNSYNPSAVQPVRRFQWWGWLSTIGGYISGNGYVWPFPSTWQNHLNTQGARDMGRLNGFIGSVAWYNLVPSGLNGMRTLVTSGGSSVSAADYVSAAAAPDGTLLAAYIPPAHNGAITVDMTAMSGLARARWFDPTSAAYTDIGTGLANTGTRSFTPTGNNSVGQKDWVLVLDRATSSAIPTISDIANQATTVNTTTAAISFTVTDAQTPAASLTLGKASSNPALVSTNNIIFGGSGTNRIVTTTPTTGQTGATTITVSVSDGTNSASDTFVLTVNAAAVTNATTTNVVSQWGRFETAFTNTIAHADLYRDVTLNVTYTRPDNTTVSFWGFYDGGTTWRIRFMPDQIGTWNYSASFSDGAPGATGSFQCVAGTIPGMISKDETNPLWFGYKGGGHTQLRSFHVGDRFFADNWPMTSRVAFLDWAQAQGYNMLSMGSLYLNRTVAGRGQGWNTPDLWDGPSRSLKAAEYQKLETLLDELAARKMIVFPFAGFFGKSSDYPLIQADQELYLRYTLARVGSYWNVVAAVAGPEPLYSEETAEYRNAMPIAELNRLGALIKSLDVFNHPLTVHNVTTQNAFATQTWESYTTLQGPKTLSRATLSSGILSAHSARPLFAAELLWPGNTLGHPVYSDTDIRKNGFVITMSAATLSFGDMNGNSSSGFSGSMNPADKIQARHDIIKRVWDFFATLQLYRLSPRQDLVNNGFCLAEPGREYLVYLESRGTVSVTVSNGPFQVEWINAQNTADRRAAAATSTGQSLVSPTDGDDWVLHLTSTAGASATPTISDILNQSTTLNTPTTAIAFTISDAQTPAGSLTLGKGSSNPTLVSTNNIVFSGNGANRSVIVTPTTGQTGTATITTSVSDGTNSASDTFVLTVNPAFTGAKTFTNTTALTLSQGAGTPYPSVINVTGMGSAVTNVTITLRNLTHTWSRDIDVLLVGPGGQKMILMSDAGNSAANNVTLTLADAASAALPTTGLASGIFRPTNYTDASAGGDNFPSPAPAAPYGSTLSGFNGQPANGVWSLYVYDDGAGDGGSIADGWSIALTTTNAAATASVPPSPALITSVSRDAQGIVQVIANGAIGFTYALEASSDRASWAQAGLQSNTTGSVTFTESPTTNLIRFYRVLSLP